MKSQNELKDCFKCLKTSFRGLTNLSVISLLCLQIFVEQPAGGFESSNTPPQEADKLGQTE